MTEERACGEWQSASVKHSKIHHRHLMEAVHNGTNDQMRRMEPETVLVWFDLWHPDQGTFAS